MRVTGIALQRTAAAAELTADIGGFRLRYRVTPPDTPLSSRGDAFAAAALVAAMVAGETLEVEGELSPRLLDGLGRIQDILRVWNPALRRIEVRAASLGQARPDAGVATFFSGGVDGSYTFLKHAAEITHLLFISGFDFRLENDALARQALARNREFAQAFGKTLVSVETNLRGLYEPRRVGPSLYQGPLLASVALAFCFPRLYVPATYTFAELLPWGSHPLLDPLWSTEAVELVHDGAEARRSEKMEAVARSPEVLRTLRVCLNNTVYNCGACEKCVRTRLNLRLLGVSAETLAPLGDVREVARLRVRDGQQATYFSDNYELAVRVGDREVARALRGCLRNYAIRTALKDLDRLLLGGRLRRFRRGLRRWRGAAPEASAPETIEADGRG